MIVTDRVASLWVQTFVGMVNRGWSSPWTTEEHQ